jgi:hypothetical protein
MIVSSTSPRLLAATCHPHCATCLDSPPSSPSACLTCAANRALAGPSPNACPCDSRFYLDSTTSACLPCSPRCRTCTGPSQSDCVLCESGAALSPSTASPGQCICVNQESYMVSYTGACLACHPSCLTCSGPAATDCLTCKPDATLFTSPGECRCADGKYMLANGTCAACHPSCRSCTDLSHLSCKACYSSASLNPSSTGQCTCSSSSTYLDLSSSLPSCQPCHSSCLKCSGPSFTNCTVCGSGATLTDTGTCLCQSGYTFSTPGPDCIPISNCPAICAGRCLSTAPAKCLSCTSTGILLSDFGCTCPSGFFLSGASTSTPSCAACSPKCLECQANPTNPTNSPSLCVQCRSPGTNPSVMDSENNDCHTNIPGTFFSMTSLTTSTCTSVGRACYGSATAYTACPADSQLRTPPQCVCPTGNQFDINNQCVLAPDAISPLCLLQGSNSYCAICSSYSERNSEMQSQCNCRQGYLKTTNSSSGEVYCAPCHPSCIYCSTLTDQGCSSCTLPLTLASPTNPPSQCTLPTNPPKFMYSMYGVEKVCDRMCSSCTTANTTHYCGECITNADKLSIPYCRCKDGYFFSLTFNNCAACHYTCKTCVGSGLNDCTQCPLDMYLQLDGSCKCKRLNYLNPSTNQCSPISNPKCKEAYYDSSEVCTKCYNNMQLPCTGCPNGEIFYSAQKGVCTTCSKWCTLMECSITNSKSTGCTVGCADNTLLLNNGVCTVQNSVAFDPMSNSFKPCNSLCLTCFGTSQDQCLTLNTAISGSLLLHPYSNILYCPKGTYINTTTTPMSCSPCPAFCSQCSSLTNCTICQGPSTMGTNNLCTCATANLTQVESPVGVCQPCHFTCKFCTDPTNNTASCLDIGGVHSFNPQVTAYSVAKVICITGYTRNTDRICAPSSPNLCHPSCATCSDSTQSPNACSSCLPAYLTQNLGASLNPIYKNCSCNGGGLYGFNEHYFCVPCHPKCSTCSSINYKQCIVCKDTNAIGPDCTCPPAMNSYLSPIDYMCKPCHLSCSTCTGPAFDQCINCAGGVVQDGICGCPDGQYRNSTTGYCDPCQPPCVRCGGTATSCKTCQPTAIYNGGTCVCKIDQYMDSTGSCNPISGLICHPSCLTCYGTNSNQCSSCQSVAYIYNGYCLCPDGYYMNTAVSPGTCTLCNYCLECSSSTICTSCGDGAFLNVTTNKCQCLPNYSGLTSTGGCLTSFTCSDIGCAACTDSSTTSPCLICKSQYATLNNSKCTCPQGMYIDSVGLCQYCSPTCYGCTSATLCSECLPPAIMSTDKKSCTCNSSQLINATGHCLDCHQSCLTCTALHNRGCSSCKPPAELQSEGWCKCPQFTVMNETTFNCDPVCHFTCGTCDGPSSTNCLTCKEGGAVYNSFTKTCACTPGKYRTITGNCEPCHNNCLTCTGPGPTECLSCKTLAVLSGKGSCVCGANKTRNSSGGCDTITCHESCVSCNGTSNTSCLSCKPQAMLSPSGACVCRSSFYADSNYVCQPCHTRCYTCSGPLATECTSCASGKYLFPNNSCECPAGQAYADATTTVCSPVNCHISCETCDGVFDNNCLSCKNGAVLDVYKRCICPASTYRKATTGECQPCQPPCLSCTGPLLSDCLTCKTNAMELAIGTSKSCRCKLGYYSDSTALKCSPCNKKCIGCDGPNENQCTMCIQATTLSNGICVPGANMQLTTDGLIRPISPPVCHETCKQCQSGSTGQYNQCTACWNKAELQSDNTCLCNQGYKRDLNGYCVMVSCHLTCKTCLDELKTSCTSCTELANLEAFPVGTCRCIPGYGFDPNGFCKPCHPTCKTCYTTAPTGCDICKDIAIKNYDGSCSCPVGTAFNTTYTACDPCPLICKSCILPKTEPNGIKSCVTCNELGILENPVLDVNSSQTIGTCVCPKPRYVATPEGKCSFASCHVTCLTCMGPNIDQCYKCKKGAVLNENKICVCKSGQPIGILGECYECDSSCATCEVDKFSAKCTSCYPMAVLSDGKCNCRDGTYFDDVSISCGDCHSTCATCKGPLSANCTSCKGSGSLLVQGRCTCTSGEKITAEGLCNNCLTSCKVCATGLNTLGPARCSVCGTDAIPNPANPAGCICKKPSYYMDPQSNCYPCFATCGTCRGPTSAECLTCKDTFILDSGTCLCNKGFFWNEVQNTCVACNPSLNCETCMNLLTCFTCPQGWKFRKDRYKGCELIVYTDAFDYSIDIFHEQLFLELNLPQLDKQEKHDYIQSIIGKDLIKITTADGGDEVTDRIALAVVPNSRFEWEQGTVRFYLNYLKDTEAFEAKVECRPFRIPPKSSSGSKNRLLVFNSTTYDKLSKDYIIPSGVYLDLNKLNDWSTLFWLLSLLATAVQIYLLLLRPFYSQGREDPKLYWLGHYIVWYQFVSLLGYSAAEFRASLDKILLSAADTSFRCLGFNIEPMFINELQSYRNSYYTGKYTASNQTPLLAQKMFFQVCIYSLSWILSLMPLRKFKPIFQELRNSLLVCFGIQMMFISSVNILNFFGAKVYTAVPIISFLVSVLSVILLAINCVLLRNYSQVDEDAPEFRMRRYPRTQIDPDAEAKPECIRTSWKAKFDHYRIQEADTSIRRDLTKREKTMSCILTELESLLIASAILGLLGRKPFSQPLILTMIFGYNFFYYLLTPRQSHWLLRGAITLMSLALTAANIGFSLIKRDIKLFNIEIVTNAYLALFVSFFIVNIILLLCRLADILTFRLSNRDIPQATNAKFKWNKYIARKSNNDQQDSICNMNIEESKPEPILSNRTETAEKKKPLVENIIMSPVSITTKKSDKNEVEAGMNSRPSIIIQPALPQMQNMDLNAIEQEKLEKSYYNQQELDDMIERARKLGKI